GVRSQGRPAEAIQGAVGQGRRGRSPQLGRRSGPPGEDLSQGRRSRRQDEVGVGAAGRPQWRPAAATLSCPRRVGALSRRALSLTEATKWHLEYETKSL